MNTIKTYLTTLLASVALLTHSFGKSIPNFAEADLVLGQVDFTSKVAPDPPGATSLNQPMSVVVDPVTRKIFVADYGNKRILRYASAAALASGAAAEFAFGQLSLTGNVDFDSNRIEARGLFIDTLGRLWVADEFHHRVLMFAAASTRSDWFADKIFGQPDAATVSLGTSASKMIYPIDVCVDRFDRLWVAEYGNNRVLRFDAISSKASGADADGVLGQTNFTTRTAGSGSSGLKGPTGITVSSSGALYVACSDANRVLRFDNAAALGNGAGASGVLGQPDYASTTVGLSDMKMKTPFAVGITADDSLWVSDSGNHRLLRFSNASTKSAGAAADGVLGQPGFTSQLINTTRSGFNFPSSKAFVDTDGSLWIADTSNNRVLRFTPPAPVVVPPIVVVDKTAPLLVISTKIPKLITKPSILLKGTASDASGVKSVQFKVGKGKLQTAKGTTAWQIKLPLKKGKNIVTLTATDNSGNISPGKLLKITRK